MPPLSEKEIFKTMAYRESYPQRPPTFPRQGVAALARGTSDGGVVELAPAVENTFEYLKIGERFKTEK
jgi:hypothetical protein